MSKPIERYAQHLADLYTNGSYAQTFDAEYAGRLTTGKISLVDVHPALLAAHFAGDDPTRYVLQKRILQNAYTMLGDSWSKLNSVRQYVVDSFDTPPFKAEYFAGIFPLGRVNALCEQVDEGAYLGLIDPGLLGVFEMATKNVMLLQAAQNGATVVPISRDHVAAIAFEYFSDLIGLPNEQRWRPTLGKVPDPVALLADARMADQFSVVARRAFDFVHYHEWGHIFSRLLPEDHAVNLPRQGPDGEIVNQQHPAITKKWANEFWADRISAAALKAQLRHMEAEEQEFYVEATIAGVAVFLGYAELGEHLSERKQSEFVETPAGVVASIHPTCAHPPPSLRLKSVVDHFDLPKGDEDRIMQTAIWTLLSFRALFEEGQTMPAEKRQQLIDAMST